MSTGLGTGSVTCYLLLRTLMGLIRAPGKGVRSISGGPVSGGELLQRIVSLVG